MAGQDATTPLGQARAQQTRISAGGNDQGAKKATTTNTQGVCEKAKHQG